MEQPQSGFQDSPQPYQSLAVAQNGQFSPSMEGSHSPFLAGKGAGALPGTSRPASTRHSRSCAAVQLCRCVMFRPVSSRVRAELLHVRGPEATAELLASVLLARLHRAAATPASGILPHRHHGAILPPCGQAEKHPPTEAGQGGPRHGDVGLSRSEFELLYKSLSCVYFFSSRW